MHADVATVFVLAEVAEMVQLNARHHVLLTVDIP